MLGNSDFVPLLVFAIKELKAANDNLRVELLQKINSQDAEIDVLHSRRDALDAAR